jgi:hypothetical protein
MSRKNAADAERSLARSGQNGEPSTASADARKKRDRQAGKPLAVLATVAIMGTAYFVLIFVALSLSTWALVIGLHRDLSKPAQSRLGLGLLGVFGIGLLVAATFPIDLDGAPETLAGTIHAINGPLIFLSLIVGTNLVSRRFKQDVRWRPIHRVASVLALIMIPEFVAGGLAASRETGAGIAQRILVLTFVAWFVLTALRLRANTTETAASEV